MKEKEKWTWTLFDFAKM